MIRFAAAVACAAVLAAPALAVKVGYVEEFNDGLGFWGGGSSGLTTYDFPTGGVGGPDDHYLRITNSAPANFGVRLTGPVPFGDWIAEGATGVSFWLNDVGDADPFEFRIAIGNSFSGLWQYNIAFTPPNNEWMQCEVDFSDPSMWTRTRGFMSFEDTLRNVDRILFRHDLFPFGPSPNQIAGDIGLDRVRILPAPGAAGLLLAAGVAGARRRR